ncbi:MAG: hypothetical protein AAGJ79_04505 [Verrucomicrobiota bacterium]
MLQSPRPIVIAELYEKVQDESMAEPTQVKASLGCGTLILIAIIVLVFGGHRNHQALENKIDLLSKDIEALRVELQAERSDEKKIEESKAVGE